MIKPHRHFEDGVSWALTSRGIAVDEAPAKGTPGEPKTVRDIWDKFGKLCAASARKFGVPVELIVATIATESSGNPSARRAEPQIGDESVGLMQTLVRTAREATGRRNLAGDDLLDPAVSIDAGTAYIAKQRTVTHFDPPLVAAAYNAGSLKRDGGSNRWRLRCFPLGTGAHIDRFTAWFSDAMRVAAEDNWAGDGTPSFAAAFRAVVPLARTDADFPSAPSFAALVSTADRQKLFGAFDFQADPRPDNKENIRILGDWVEKNIVRVEIPVQSVLGKPGPLVMQFHRLGAEQLKAMWLEWEKQGLLDRVLSFDGAFVPRFIRGSTSSLSNHAFGTAFDINAAQNPLKAEPALVGERGSVRELVEIANRFGFYWGGHFKSRPDGMHFEIAQLK